MEFVISAGPGEFGELVADARCHEDNGRLPDASAALQRALVLNPDATSLAVWLGWIEIRLGNFARASEYALTIAQPEERNYAASRRLLVFANAYSGDWAQAGNALGDLAARSTAEAAALARESATAFLSLLDERYRQEAFGEVAELFSLLPGLVRSHGGESAGKMALIAAQASLKMRRCVAAIDILHSASPGPGGGRAARSAGNPLAGVTLLTSIMPGRKDVQRQAIESWRRCGAKVVSLNAADEMSVLKDDYPDVEFSRAGRDARKEFAKPYVYMRDMMRTLAELQDDVVGIINSDIAIDTGACGVLEGAVASARESFTFGYRYDVKTLSEMGVGGGSVPFPYGFDWFLFPRSAAARIDGGPFVFGCPWWDLWLPFAALHARVKTVLIEEAFAYHQLHPTNWSEAAFVHFGEALISEVRRIDASASVGSAVRQVVDMVNAAERDIAGSVEPAVFFEWIAELLRTVFRHASSPLT
ncbi:MAG: hypothetical protein JWL91_1668 [Sphingomonas bacterium]|nr:hypothetical protein [Sphingomonas bacterium]MDB5689792.1 hypothetical protein [Sphingomonas bacterium]